MKTSWKRWLNRLEWVGIAIGFAGVAFLNLESQMKASPVGAIALLVASVCWAFGSAWSSHLSIPKGLMSVAVQVEDMI